MRPPGHRIETCVDHRDPPRLRNVRMDVHLTAIGKIKRNVRCMQIIICKPVFDVFLLVSCTYNEVIDAVVRIYLHNMPKDGHTANLDHGLRPKMTFLRNARTEPAGKL